MCPYVANSNYSNKECTIGVTLDKFVIILRTLFLEAGNLLMLFAPAWPRESEEYVSMY